MQQYAIIGPTLRRLVTKPYWFRMPLRWQAGMLREEWRREHFTRWQPVDHFAQWPLAEWERVITMCASAAQSN